MLIPLIFTVACNNTSPNRGSGGNHVEDHTTLGTHAIVDSAKAIIDQSFLLQEKLESGKITDSAFAKQHSALLLHYESIHQGLSPADRSTIYQYKLEREAEFQKRTKKTNAQKWE